MVEVADAGQGFNGSLARPRVVAGSASASGWGLFLVDRIADRWGAVQVGGETRGWFELRPGAQPVAFASEAAGARRPALGGTQRSPDTARLVAQTHAKKSAA